MKIIKLILIVTFTFLLAVGAQGAIVGFLCEKVFNFQEYSLFGWVVQITYFIIAICLGILWWDDECN